MNWSRILESLTRIARDERASEADRAWAEEVIDRHRQGRARRGWSLVACATAAVAISVACCAGRLASGRSAKADEGEPTLLQEMDEAYRNSRPGDKSLRALATRVIEAVDPERGSGRQVRSAIRIVLISGVDGGQDWAARALSHDSKQTRRSAAIWLMQTDKDWRLRRFAERLRRVAEEIVKEEER